LSCCFFGQPGLAQIRYSIPEEVKDGTVVGNVAKDLGLDIASLSDRRFRVVSETKDGIFEVNPDTGKSLDREQINKHTLLVTAVDGGKPPRSGTLNVSIIVLDSNDNKPIFSQEVYQIAIQENVPVGTSIFRINATDSDEGSNGEIEYSLGKTLMREVYDIFELDKISGEIRVKNSVNYEETDLYELDVEASDKGTPPETGECRVIIKIIDVNDNAPEIEVTSLSNIVSEDSKPGTVISLIKVKDKDSGVNGKIIVHITNDVPFELKPSYKENTYSIVTKGLLDREKVSFYEITIKATDCGEPPLSTFKTLNIQISDVNDNSPRFQQSPLEFYLIENNVAGQSILSVSATDDDLDNNLQSAHDPDAGINSIRTYTLTSNEYFEINIRQSDANKVPFLVLKKLLDREQINKHTIVVTALDGGKPQRSGTLNVSIIVLDSNDNRPVFSQEIYHISVKENVLLGTLIFKMNATDADEGTNGEIEYRLGKALLRKVYDIFELDKISGEIRVKGLIDYEENEVYELDVQAIDKGTPPETGECRVIIKIIDVNDNAPEIEVTSLSNTVPEDSKPGTVISLIRVRDKDSGVNGKIIVHITNDVPFELKPSYKENTYSIVTKGLLDREKVSFYEITIKATDCGEPPLSTFKTLNIQISDVNDNSPHFQQSPLEFYLVENNVAGQSILSVSATDDDLDNNAVLSYHIARDGSQNDIMSFLNIHSDNGHITALKSFDFETLKTFQFQVVATDSGTPSLSNNVTVNVFILDQNDNAPVILYPLSSNGSAEGVEEIPRNVNAGHLVTKVRAYDADIGYNGWLLFSLQEVTDHSLFGLDRYTGQIRTLRSFTETDENKHSLLVTALDGGKPPKSGKLNVSIIVLDNNDNRPTFSQDTYLIEIYENTTVGTTVTAVNAIDPDEGTNGDVEYSLSKTLARPVYDIFDLDHLSGQITLKKAVDFEETDTFKLDIQASDKGQPSLTGRCRVIIKIKDVNDNPPEIEITSLSDSVPEDSKPGTAISLISVTDKDSGVNGKTILRITSDVPFELKASYKENIYSVVTKGLLDREVASSYEITIKATDLGEPPISTFKTLNIQISDVNDNSPIFHHNPLQFYLSENNSPGASVFSVSATDNDVNENAAISYDIVRARGENDVTQFLNINSENGHISALKSFDFETVKKFQFQVVATDSGTPSLSNNVTVNVFILDQNDNAPVILYPLSSNGSAEGVEEIPRNANAGHLVTKVRAYDADIGYNGWLLFSLQEVTDHSLFGLDRYTGQIRTLRSFTETDEAEHKLVILVKDNGNVSLSATATVVVKVVEPKEAFAASDVKSASKDDDSNVTFYLMITLGSVSALFIISIIVLIAMQCSKTTDYTSKYLEDKNYDGTLCHSIQYRSGDKRYMLVGPRMSIGSTIVPGSNANTLVLPDRRKASGEVRLCVGFFGCKSTGLMKFFAEVLSNIV
uniref:Protocadherin alpha-13-like n=1 Tax=Sphaeramia orbicularis TaxID=375764 RepID=A0A672YM71_9TELE